MNRFYVGYARSGTLPCTACGAGLERRVLFVGVVAEHQHECVYDSRFHLLCWDVPTGFTGFDQGNLDRLRARDLLEVDLHLRFAAQIPLLIPSVHRRHSPSPRRPMCVWGISGPSRCGKKTLARRLSRSFASPFAPIRLSAIGPESLSPTLDSIRDAINQAETSRSSILSAVPNASPNDQPSPVVHVFVTCVHGFQDESRCLLFDRHILLCPPSKSYRRNVECSDDDFDALWLEILSSQRQEYSLVKRLTSSLPTVITNANNCSFTDMLPPQRVVWIGIAGPSNSGKTTLARRLVEELDSSIEVLSLDSFFRPASELPLAPPHDSSREYNMEIPSAIDFDDFESSMNRIERQLTDTRSLVQIHLRRHQADKSLFRGMRLVEESNDNDDSINIVFVIVEGFLLFVEKWVADRCDLKIWMETERDICCERRMARDGIEQDWFENVVWAEYLRHRDLQLQNIGIIMDGSDREDVLRIDASLGVEVIVEQTLDFVKKGCY